ncbi:winged helix-turn-helix domain-containing protein [Nonomuraea cavernae]|uniref:Transcriptional regulator n=1 Tax=Nonomuraea cavernae TaxID=2045107 RepID=A0A917YS99_9ACTN|nr:helix-turn-helix domain-containing protein [Nonomuraea cavernae]MCA2184549.1 helix-turn-helix domain-containing protein [Nonomuraea cavernae]GGO63454.1 transcriptional regulator [Nonomuraea cavernae]
MAESRTTRRIDDLGELKAFAHPLRLKLYRALVVARTATASQLADQVDEAVSLVSYHLRKLAALGLIEEAEPQSGDGRERWWQVAYQQLNVTTSAHDAPETAAARLALTRVAFRQQREMHDAYLDVQSTWEPQWQEAAIGSEYLTEMTAAELRELSQEMHALIQKWQTRGRAALEAGDTEGREHVALHLYGFPFRT